MNVEKKDLEKSQVELLVKLTVDEFKPYIKQAADKISREVKIDGFRPGHIPMDVLKQKIGEMSILEEAAMIAVNKTIGLVIKNNLGDRSVGQPKIDITKLAPNNPLEFKAVITVVPEIKIADYKSAKAKKDTVKIEDKEVERVIEELRDMRVSEKIVDRDAMDTDKVLVNIKMFLDKVPLEGGQNKDVTIIIGKDYVIPGFDKKIIGAKKNDVREFELLYPSDYHIKNIAGKIVEFVVDIKEVYERVVLEINDSFAVSFGLKNLEELKKNIHQTLEQRKNKEVTEKADREIIDQLVEKSRFTDLPEILIQHETDVMLDELRHSVEEQGGSFDDYLVHIGKNLDQLTLEILPNAVKRVKASLIIREIANLENIKVLKEELDDHVVEMKKHYSSNADMLANLQRPEYRSYAANVLNSQKVIDRLREWNIDK